MRVWRSGTICLELLKRAKSSNSAAEDMSNLMIWERMGSGPLLAGMGISLERKMWYLDLLWAVISLSKDTSDFPARTMLMVR